MTSFIYNAVKKSQNYFIFYSIAIGNSYRYLFKIASKRGKIKYLYYLPLFVKGVC